MAAVSFEGDFCEETVKAELEGKSRGESNRQQEPALTFTPSGVESAGSHELHEERLGRADPPIRQTFPVAETFGPSPPARTSTARRPLSALPALLVIGSFIAIPYPTTQRMLRSHNASKEIPGHSTALLQGIRQATRPS